MARRRRPGLTRDGRLLRVPRAWPSTVVMLLDAVWAVQGEKRPKRSFVRNSHSDLGLKWGVCVARRLRPELTRDGRLLRVPRAWPSTVVMLLDAVWAVKGEKRPQRS